MEMETEGESSAKRVILPSLSVKGRWEGSRVLWML